MTISETLELISETRDFLIEDYEFVYKKQNPSSKELLKHVKDSFKEGDLDELLEEILLEYDFNNVEEDYKILLLISACVCKQ
jgi:hypothetical protein